MRKVSKSFCRVDQLELRRLLSTIYVDAIAPGPTHDGSSWTNAFTDLQQALSTAAAGTVIKVGVGTYNPTPGSSRSATFQLINGVTIDGGYAGYGQSNPDARDPALFPTILSGDIGTAGDNLDNSDHVVTASNTNSTAILDGVTIMDGNADQTDGKGGGIYDNLGDATINDCIITGNTAFVGGGIYEGAASLTLTDCTLTSNSASDGGAIATSNSTTTITDCIISGNTATTGAGISDEGTAATLINTILSGNQAGQSGGAMYNYACSPSLTNCTISGNTAVQGGGIFNIGTNSAPASPALINSILWGDAATNGNEIYNSTSSSATVTFSDIDQSGFTATGNMDADPVFVRNPGTNGSTDFGDLHLQNSSPAINVGSNTAVSNITTDLMGNSRIIDGTVDLGAFESGATATATHLVISTQPASTTAGSPFSVIVEVEDQNGNIVNTDDSNVTAQIATGAPGASLGGALTIAAQNGIATFNNLSLTTASAYTLSFSDDSLAGATSNSFTISASTPASLAISQQPTNNTAGQSISAVDVQVKDQFGNLVDGSNVTIAIAGGASGAILGGTLTIPTINGVANFSNLTLNRAGTFTLSASDGSVTPAVTNSFGVTYAGPQLVFSSEPANNAVAGAKLSAITVQTVDTTGTLVTTGKSKILLTLSSGGKLLGTANATVKNGQATFSKLSIQKAGTYTITASDPSFASAISTNFTITAAAAAKLLFDPQPAGVVHGTPFNVQVELIDRYGNLAGNGSTATLALGSHPKTATALNSSDVVSNGLADFDAITLDTAGNYTLKANDGKLKATSKKFAVN
jgi:hypothetical protein